MIILKTLPPYEADTILTPLNAVWSGEIAIGHAVQLPLLGHIILICPLGSSGVVCGNHIIDSNTYMFVLKQQPPSALRLSPLNSETATVLILFLNPDFLADMANFLNIPPQFQDMFHAVSLLQGDALANTLQLMSQHLDAYQQAEELFLECVGQILRLQVLRQQSLVQLRKHKNNTIADLVPRLLRARQFIEAKYTEKIKTKTIAEQVALSEFYFARLFKTAFDTTVHQYVLKLRLEKAHHLLELTDESITEIAFAVGYTSLSAFIHAFHKRFSMSPSTYRSRLQN